MAYTTITLAAAYSALAARLQDPLYVHWTVAELTIYLAEAVRTWAAYTQPFYNTGVFSTTYGEAFYDLPTMLPALRALTVTDRDLLTAIEYQLLEPSSGAGAWVGTSQFTLTDLVTAIQRRRSDVASGTGTNTFHGKSRFVGGVESLVQPY